MRSPVRSQASATIDPILTATATAAVTERLGVAVTKSTTFFHPYEVARIFATLDHLSGGRTGWNIVTSLNSAEAQNFGTESHLDHDPRYAHAPGAFDEFVDQVVPSCSAATYSAPSTPDRRCAIHLGLDPVPDLAPAFV
jgi:alkanesulfonate monooxygenase SsuD/methylene tetrahydromethanopterin reductase-like flavin-dependent oxidoreductase (luciferase family)